MSITQSPPPNYTSMLLNLSFDKLKNAEENYTTLIKDYEKTRRKVIKTAIDRSYEWLSQRIQATVNNYMQVIVYPYDFHLKSDAMKVADHIWNNFEGYSRVWRAQSLSYMFYRDCRRAPLNSNDLIYEQDISNNVDDCLTLEDKRAYLMSLNPKVY